MVIHVLAGNVHRNGGCSLLQHEVHNLSELEIKMAGTLYYRGFTLEWGVGGDHIMTNQTPPFPPHKAKPVPSALNLYTFYQNYLL